MGRRKGGRRLVEARALSRQDSPQLPAIGNECIAYFLVFAPSFSFSSLNFFPMFSSLVYFLPLDPCFRVSAHFRYSLQFPHSVFRLLFPFLFRCALILHYDSQLSNRQMSLILELLKLSPRYFKFSCEQLPFSYLLNYKHADFLVQNIYFEMLFSWKTFHKFYCRI